MPATRASHHSPPHPRSRAWLFAAAAGGVTLVVAGALAGSTVSRFLPASLVAAPLCAQGLGDVNQDSDVTQADVDIIALAASGSLQPGTPPFTAPASAGDMNEDGALTSMDSRILTEFLDGSIACLPIFDVVANTCPEGCSQATTPGITLSGPTQLVADGEATAIVVAQLTNYPTIDGVPFVEGLVVQFSSSESDLTFNPEEAAVDANGYTTTTIQGAARTGNVTAQITAREEQFSTVAYRDILLVGAPPSSAVSSIPPSSAVSSIPPSSAVSSIPPSSAASSIPPSSAASSPPPQGSFVAALTVPLEGRLPRSDAGHGSYRTASLTAGFAGLGLTGVTERTNLSTDDAGRVTVIIPGTTVPAGARVTVTLKTAQHLRRVVVGTATTSGLIVDLGIPGTYQDPATNLLRGKPFLVSGDIEGSGALHDNRVDATDIAAWVGDFRRAEQGVVSDLDGNGAVGAEDLSLIIRNFNVTGDPITLPLCTPTSTDACCDTRDGGVCPSSGTTPSRTPSSVPSSISLGPNEVLITDAGFTPPSIAIEVGEQLTFINGTTREVAIASDPHPEDWDSPWAYMLIGPPPIGRANSSYYDVGTWVLHDEQHPDHRVTVTVAPRAAAPHWDEYVGVKCRMLVHVGDVFPCNAILSETGVTGPFSFHLRFDNSLLEYVESAPTAVTAAAHVTVTNNGIVAGRRDLTIAGDPATPLSVNGTVSLIHLRLRALRAATYSVDLNVVNLTGSLRPNTTTTNITILE